MKVEFLHITYQIRKKHQDGILTIQLPFKALLSKITLCLATIALTIYSIDSFAKTTHEGYRKVSGGKQYMYRLSLTDKNDCGYDLNHPEEFLSAKAISRRQRQHLVVDSTDLPVSHKYIEQISTLGLSIVSTSKWNNSIVVKGKSQKQLERLSELPFVSKATHVWTSPDSLPPHQKRVPCIGQIPNWDILVINPYGACQQQTTLIGGQHLKRGNYTGKGITIAVLDGGFMNVDRIPAMKDINIIGTKDFVVPASSDIFKEIDHGTKVLSTMAVNIPYIFEGTAPDASYLLLRCEDNDTEMPVEEDYWARAAEYADSMGVDIINSSLGFHSFDNKAFNHHYTDLDGHGTFISNTASMLASKGILLVCSAGNEGMGTWKKINPPADAIDVLTVGSVGETGQNSPFSSIGPTADNRVKPDIMAMGGPASVISGRGVIMQDMGTSFSSPIIAGLAACLWQARPQLTVTQLIQLIISSSSNFSTPDNIYGYGIPDFSKALKNSQ